jgi:LacI family transcriptional regulator
MRRLQGAADRIGFYGVGAIKHRIRKSATHNRFGFVLQQSTRDLYQLFAKKIAAASRNGE